MPFHLWSIDTPKYFSTLLPEINKSGYLTNDEFTILSSDLGLTDVSRRVSHLTQYWYVMGILDRIKEDKKYKYGLSNFGKELANIINFNISLCYDIMHFLFYRAWEIEQNTQWGWSWVYKEIVDHLWETQPQKIDPKQLHSIMLSNADSKLIEYNPKINPIAIDTTISWLLNVKPPFLIKGIDESEQTENQNIKNLFVKKRQLCNPELIILALNHQYTLRKIHLSTALLIDENVLECISKTCLIDINQFWPLVEISLLTYPGKLSRKETLYGTSLILNERLIYDPPPPRDI